MNDALLVIAGPTAAGKTTIGIEVARSLGGEIVDLPTTARISTRALIRRLLDEVADHARDLGCADELSGVHDLLDRGNGAQRQVVVYEANRDKISNPNLIYPGQVLAVPRTSGRGGSSY